MPVVLASTSPYRRRLLARLQLPFQCDSPGVEESIRPGEGPADRALRLALEKAQAVAARHPASLVIGSDQVASIGDRVIRKPGCFDAALEQLRASSGRAVSFHTAVAIICSDRSVRESHVELFRVHFRQLDDITITRYLEREEPYDCAGSFKWESLGIALFSRMEGDDPTSLEGLPLIALTGLLERAGHPVLGPS